MIVRRAGNNRIYRDYFVVDLIRFLFLLGVTFFIVYQSPSVIYTRIVFLFFLPIIYFTKNDFFWLAWLFVIVDAPGLLFKGGGLDDPFRIPIYTLASNASFNFVELVIVVFILKILTNKGRRNWNFFKGHFQIFVFLIIFYCGVTIAFLDFDLFQVIRVIAPWALVYIAVVFLNDEQKLNRFNNIIFFIVFIVFLTQAYLFVTGGHLVNQFKADKYHIKTHLSREVSEYSINAARPLYSMFLVLYATIMINTYLFRRRQVFDEKYLYLVLSFCFLTGVLSGTRGYLLALCFIIVVSLLIKIDSPKRIINIGGLVVTFIGLLIVLPFFVPSISYQLSLVLERFQTVFLLFGGDMTAGGTVGRATERIPKIMEYIKESPFVGFGFSRTYFENADSDIGLFTNILNVGLIGVILLFIFLYDIVRFINKKTTSKMFVQRHGKIGVLFTIGFIGILIFHFTTNIAFGLIPVADGALYERYMIYGFILATVNTLANYISLKRL